MVALAAAASGLRLDTPIDREEAARRAADELLKPAYERESLIDQIYRRVMQFLGDLLDRVPGGGPTGGMIAAMLIVTIIFALIVLISWQLRNATRKNALAVGGLFGTRAMTAAEHRTAAERLAAEGRWSEAIQERLRAIARDLEERALVDGMPGRTADELAAEAAISLPGFATRLAAAARSFDDVTYGGVPGTREAYEVMSTLDDQLREARPVPLATPVPAGVGAGAGAPMGPPAAPAVSSPQGPAAPPSGAAEGVRPGDPAEGSSAGVPEQPRDGAGGAP
ncbi:DUF4129 domain-containing protein [Nonomuraea sp. NPDC050786]|uniref:DUF4129 domain-containing protein n=1 Tax=Nonomuraea sp. NPDC050786 TaxID=3154840 RepID=UPI0033ED9DBC